MPVKYIVVLCVGDLDFLRDTMYINYSEKQKGKRFVKKIVIAWWVKEMHKSVSCFADDLCSVLAIMQKKPIFVSTKFYTVELNF